MQYTDVLVSISFGINTELKDEQSRVECLQQGDTNESEQRHPSNC